jgi:PIN domain nuclease of toxin-antitoxin system
LCLSASPVGKKGSQAIDAEVIFLSGELPRAHSDPFDRLIAAESIHHQVPVITPDEPFSELGAQRLW